MPHSRELISGWRNPQLRRAEHELVSPRYLLLACLLKLLSKKRKPPQVSNQVTIQSSRCGGPPKVLSLSPSARPSASRSPVWSQCGSPCVNRMAHLRNQIHLRRASLEGTEHLWQARALSQGNLMRGVGDGYGTRYTFSKPNAPHLVYLHGGLWGVTASIT